MSGLTISRLKSVFLKGTQRSRLTQYLSASAGYSVGAVRSYNAHIKPESLQITKTTNPKEKLAYEKLVFGRSFSDHMLEIDWDEKSGWHNPVIKPYGDFKMSPAATVLHYGIEVCFRTGNRVHRRPISLSLSLPNSSFTHACNTLKLTPPPINHPSPYKPT